MLTLKQIQNKQKEIIEKIEKEYEWVQDNPIPKKIPENIEVYYDIKRISYKIFELEFKELKQKIKEIDQKVEELKNNGFYPRVSEESDYDEYSASYNFVVYYYSKKSKDIRKELAERRFSLFMRKYIFSFVEEKENIGYSKQVDCTNLKLFMNGKIDTETLIELTYGTCDL